MNYYAGIGSRQTPQKILQIMYQSAQILGKQGYTLKTGAAQGADQAFANGASSINSPIILCLPWKSYEYNWYKTLNNYTLTTPPTQYHYNIAKQHHPIWDNLSQGAKKLHARNVQIIENTSFVICYTPNATLKGGTAMGIRIATSLNIPIYNLGNKTLLNNFKKRINELL